MIDLSANLVTRYTSFLTENGIETNRHHFYLKWLRYYLHFCTKYSFEWSKNDSLSALTQISTFRFEEVSLGKLKLESTPQRLTFFLSIRK